MTCCQCQGIETHFDHQKAVKKLDLYRREGPSETTSMLIKALKAKGVEGMSLLDIGGGVGAIQYELLKAGVREVTNVEASTGYFTVAKQEAERRGYAERITYHQGNFVDLAPQLPSADIVTLDRVICCYHDMPTMLALSATRAHQLMGIVYPRQNWRAKLWCASGNFSYWWEGNPFRLFLHSTEAVEACLRHYGFERYFYQETSLWKVVVYAK